MDKNLIRDYLNSLTKFKNVIFSLILSNLLKSYHQINHIITGNKKVHPIESRDSRDELQQLKI